MTSLRGTHGSEPIRTKPRSGATRCVIYEVVTPLRGFFILLVLSVGSSRTRHPRLLSFWRYAPDATHRIHANGMHGVSTVVFCATRLRQHTVGLFWKDGIAGWLNGRVATERIRCGTTWDRHPACQSEVLCAQTGSKITGQGARTTGWEACPTLSRRFAADLLLIVRLPALSRSKNHARYCAPRDDESSLNPCSYPDCGKVATRSLVDHRKPSRPPGNRFIQCASSLSRFSF